MDNEFIDKEKVDAREALKAAKTKKKQKTRTRQEVEKKPSAFVQILNGDFLTKEFMLGNLSFIFFVMLLLLLTVSKGYYGKRLSDDVNKTQEELNELTSDHFEAKTRLEEETQRVKLVDELAPQGLKETVNPTKVIRVKKK
ncbi:MAG: FtsL-like putative cell division protein [Crocinitomicaceae bacterium]|nr:FtsL-like putative cell division protein [Crocinitomicaceae bacterium]